MLLDEPQYAFHVRWKIMMVLYSDLIYLPQYHPLLGNHDHTHWARVAFRQLLAVCKASNCSECLLDLHQFYHFHEHQQGWSTSARQFSNLALPFECLYQFLRGKAGKFKQNKRLLSEKKEGKKATPLTCHSIFKIERTLAVHTLVRPYGFRATNWKSSTHGILSGWP